MKSKQGFPEVLLFFLLLLLLLLLFLSSFDQKKCNLLCADLTQLREKIFVSVGKVRVVVNSVGFKGQKYEMAKADVSFYGEAHV